MEDEQLNVIEQRLHDDGQIAMKLDQTHAVQEADIKASEELISTIRGDIDMVIDNHNVTIHRVIQPTQNRRKKRNQMSTSDILPNDFNWVDYRTLNPDLGFIKCYQNAMRHYIDIGRMEGRQYKIDTVKVKKPYPLCYWNCGRPATHSIQSHGEFGVQKRNICNYCKKKNETIFHQS